MQYSPLVIHNDAGLIANQRLYRVFPKAGVSATALCAVLNSTIFAAERYAAVKALGREAAIDVEVFSAKMLRVPDLRRLNASDISRLEKAMKKLGSRHVGAMREDGLQGLGHEAALAYARQNPVTQDVWPYELQDETRQEIDRLVLKALGLKRADIGRTRNNVYNDLIGHTRKLRILELEAQINRQGSSTSSRQTPRQLADEAWGELLDERTIEVRIIPDSFVEPDEDGQRLTLPRGRMKREEASLFNPQGVYACRIGQVRLEFADVDSLQLVMFLAQVGVTGDVIIPRQSKRRRELLTSMQEYLDATVEALKARISDFSNDAELQARILEEAKRVLVRH